MMSAIVGFVPVINSDLVRFNLFEYCYCCEVLGDYCICGHFSVSALDDPFYEMLAGYKWALRHGFDLVARSSEVLGEGLLNGTVIVEYDEAYGVHVGESALEYHISIDHFTAVVLCLSDIPADKLMTFLYRSCRQLELVSLGVFVSLISFLSAVDHVLIGDGKCCLLVLCPDFHITGGCDTVREVSTAVDPLAYASVLVRNSRNVIQAIAGVDIDRSGCYNRTVLAVKERHSVSDLSVVRNERCVSRRYIG